MGVVYKLKKEIVDFIINEKKSNPALGCRNLVGLLETRFQAKISKSAINAVIKSARLSSSIGRKPIVAKLSSLRHSERSPKGEVKNLIKEDPSLDTPPQSQNFDLRHSEEHSDEESHREEILRFAQDDGNTLFRKTPTQDKGVLCDGAGCFFLKAAQWELFRRPILGKMVSKYVNPELISDADTLLEILLFLPMFGIRRAEDISTYRGCGLWAIQGLTEGIKPDKFLSLVNGIQDKKDFSLHLSNEIPQIFFEAAYIKIVLEDQSEFVLDAQYRNLRSIKERPVYYSSPIEKSLERLTGQMIANRRPVIIKNISTQIIGGQDDNGFSPSVYQLIAAFENMPGKRMAKAAILDEHGEEVSKFTAIPVKRRFFIMGVQTQQIKMFVEASEFCEENFLVKKNSVLTEDLQLRAIFVKKPGSKSQILGAVLTNIPESDRSSAEVISEYLKEWSYFSRMSSEDQEETDKDFHSDTKISFNKGEIPDLWNNLGAILAGLNQYCQRHFFPKDYARMDISVLQERFYQLTGYLKKNSGSLEVSLILPEGYTSRPDLEYTVRKLNEFHVQNYAGQTLFLKIVP